MEKLLITYGLIGSWAATVIVSVTFGFILKMKKPAIRTDIIATEVSSVYLCLISIVLLVLPPQYRTFPYSWELVLAASHVAILYAVVKPLIDKYFQQR